MGIRKKLRSGKTGKSGRKTKGRAAGRRRKIYKEVGSARTRSMVRGIGERILSQYPNCTAVEMARRLGVVPHDINNIKAGNQPSLDIVIKLIRNGRFSPESIIYGRSLRKLGPRVSTQPVQKRLISARIRKLARSKPARQWSRSTGLSVHSVYQLRISGARAGIHTVLGFINAGVPVQQLFYGR